MKYKGVVTLNINGKEYIKHNAGSDYLFEIILNYLLYGNYSSYASPDGGGFLNYFNIGYIEDD